MTARNTSTHAAGENLLADSGLPLFFEIENFGEPGVADPVETHVYLATTENDEFARQCLDMGEQTCYLHALCRTPLDTRISIRRIS